ncbi:hypothetical protein N9W57_03715 [Pseudomonadales bacterium]|nr:hypothetical protein [Pseudomonadales bacterium]
MAKCSECGGDNAKKLSVIEKLGSSSGTATGTGIGVTGGGIGVGAHSTRTRSKTDAARESEFHSTVDIKHGVVGTIGPWVSGAVLLILWYNGEFWAGLIVGFVMLFLSFFIDTFTESGQRASDEWISAYREEKNTYAKTWMCLDCGYKWVGKK